MDSMQQNLLILGGLAGIAVVAALLAGALASQSLREEGLGRLIRRWLRR